MLLLVLALVGATDKVLLLRLGDVAETVHPLLLVTVTVYVPVAETDPLGLLPAIPLLHA